MGDPFIDRLLELGFDFEQRQGSGATTFIATQSHIADGLYYVHRGREKDLHQADQCFDRGFGAIARSITARASVVTYSESPSMRVTAFSEALDERLRSTLGHYLIFKEPIADGSPDTLQVQSISTLARAFYESAHLPSVERATRTHRRLVSWREGVNLGREYLQQHPGQSHTMMQRILDDSCVMQDYMRAHPELAPHAVPEQYRRKFSSSMQELCAQLPLRQRIAAKLISRRDARKLQHELSGGPMLYHFDPASINITIKDDELCYIDLEKVDRVLVHKDHYFAHVYWDNNFAIPLQERMDRSELSAGSYFYLVRQAARALRGGKVPFDHWKAPDEKRLQSYISFLEHFVRHPSVQATFSSATYLADHVDFDALCSRVRIRGG
jgi:hypothetical protein